MFNYKIGIGIPYNESKINRKAARAIIIKEGLLLVLKSDNPEVKLPGGGLKKRETYTKALKREVKEETGFIVKDFKYFGKVTTNRINNQDNTKVFSMESRYYLAKISDIRDKPNLEGYEIRLHFRPSFIPVEEAIKINEEAIKLNLENEIAQRELIVFKEILKYINNK